MKPILVIRFYALMIIRTGKEMALLGHLCAWDDGCARVKDATCEVVSLAVWLRICGIVAAKWGAHHACHFPSLHGTISSFPDEKTKLKRGLHDGAVEWPKPLWSFNINKPHTGSVTHPSRSRKH